MATTKSLYEQIVETTEVRRHNGQCAYGDWIALSDAPASVQEAIADEIAEAMSRDMRREPEQANTDDAGSVEFGGDRYVYRR